MAGKDLYYDKYLKYKNKYLNLKNQIGGDITDSEKEYYEQSNDVTFPNIQIGNENEILAILECLRINKHLKRLTFQNISQILDNPLFEEVLLPSLSMIAINKEITHLNFIGNRQQNIQLEDKHILKLIKILKLCEFLEHINFTNNNITILGFNQLIYGLEEVNFNRNKDSTFKTNIVAHFEGNPILLVPIGNPLADTLRQRNELFILARDKTGIFAHII
jgi:hypothetical protein